MISRWCGVQLVRRKYFLENSRKICAQTRTCGHPQKKAVSGVFSKKDDSASGYSWFAREP